VQIMMSVQDKDKDYRMNKYVEAAQAHFRTHELEAEAVLDTYFNDSVGVGEHSDLPEEIYKWVDKLAAAKDCLDVLKSYVDEGDKADLDGT